MSIQNVCKKEKARIVTKEDFKASASLHTACANAQLFDSWAKGPRKLQNKMLKTKNKVLLATCD